ncbi:hypothetical protein SDC9_25454 [bioreactor metagenome]|uniref:Secretion system C-terminal sorting domain-containing protein n=1 Tax=bioreactor metagenome TaxID=1076179 RepID=A0A644UKV9_9ZZZZ
MKKSLLVLLVILFAINLSSKAEDFSAVYNGDTIYYNITSSVYPYTASVTFRGSTDYSYTNEYSGSLSIPDSVLYNGNCYLVSNIGNNAFAYCQELITVEIPNSVTSIDDNAFYNCRSLNSIIIPNSVTSIGNHAFESCIELTSIIIPNSVITIGARVFYDCLGLTSVQIPSSVTSIGMACFYYTPWYNAFPDGEIYINNFLYEYKTSCTVDLDINVREGTVSVSEYAFYWANHLLKITFPNSLVSIGDNAFENCAYLTSITCNSTTPPSLGTDVFKYVNKSIPIYVPEASLALYQAAEGWRDFYNIQALELDDIINNNNIDIVIYPNPAQDKAKIRIDNLYSKADIIVLDIMGKEVKRDVIAKGIKELELNVSDLPKGIYNILILNETISQTKKLIITK